MPFEFAPFPLIAILEFDLASNYFCVVPRGPNIHPI